MANANNVSKNSNDQSGKKFDRAYQNLKNDFKKVDPDQSVRETEDASLPDKEYAFGEDNTDLEEYHDADDEDLEDMFGNEDNEEDLQ